MNINTFFDNSVKLIELKTFKDDRGCFLQSFDETVKNIINENILQENISYSKHNVVRGLHYQYNKPMGKLVQCVNGKIKDIFVDIRKDSKTFGKVEIVLLDSPEKLLWIPDGFAHGFLSLEDNTIVKYMCSAYYNKDGEGSINFFDETFDLEKLLNIDKKNIIISTRDISSISFKEYIEGLK